MKRRVNIITKDQFVSYGFANTDNSLDDMMNCCLSGIDKDLCDSNENWNGLFNPILNEKKELVRNRVYDAYFVPNVKYTRFNHLLGDFDGEYLFIKRIDDMGVFVSKNTTPYTSLTKLDCKALEIDYQSNLVVFEIGENWKCLEPEKFGTVIVPLTILKEDQYDELVRLSEEIDNKPNFDNEKKIGGLVGIIGIAILIIFLIIGISGTLLFCLSGLLVTSGLGFIIRGFWKQRQREERVDLISYYSFKNDESK